MAAREINKEFNFKSVANAGDALQDRLRQDESLGKDLFDQFMYRSDIAGCHRYFVEPYRSFLGPMIERGESIQLPASITSHFQRVECAAFMGLIPEINRAWITIDNTLYLWNYFKPEEYETYDGLTETIVSVALSVPKAGIFQESVQYVLVLATPTDVTVLALCNAGNSPNQNIKLVPTAYTLSSDNVTMVKIVGSQSGRIFMAGNDGNIYELDYSYSENPWSSIVGGVPQHKCRKINHFAWNWRLVHLLPPFLRSLAEVEDTLVEVVMDNVRNLLYAISSKGNLNAFYLGSKGNETHLFSSDFNILEQAKGFLSSYRAPHESSPRPETFRDLDLPSFQVMGMFIIPYTESKKTHLVVVLTSGVRIYLSVHSGYHAPYNKLPTGHHDQTPSSIEVAHVRSPPSLSTIASVTHGRDENMSDAESGSLPSFAPNQCMVANSAYYSHGLYLVGVEKPQQSDELLVIFEDEGVRTNMSSSSTTASHYLPCLKEGLIIGLDGRSQTGKIYDIKENASIFSNSRYQMLRALFSQSQTPTSNTLVKDTSTFQPSQPSLSTTRGGLSNVFGDLAGLFGQSNFDVSSTDRYIPMTYGNDLLSSPIYGYDNQNADKSIILNEGFDQHLPTSSCFTQRQIFVLTNEGIHVFKKLRPADILYRYLSTVQQQSDDQIKRVFAFYGLLPSCTMALAIACGLPRDVGTAPLIDTHYALLNSIMAVDNLQLRAMGALLAFSTPATYKVIASSTTSQSLHDSRLVMTGNQHEFFKSTVNDSLYLLVSRILRPIWLRPVVSQDKTGALKFPFYWKREYMEEIKRPLNIIAELMRNFFPAAIIGNYSKLTTTGSLDRNEQSSSSQRDMITDVIAQRAAQQQVNTERLLAFQAKAYEDSSLQSIYLLISRAVHALQLIEIIDTLVSQYSLPISIVDLADISYRTLVTSPTQHINMKKIIHKMIQSLAVLEKDNLADELIAKMSKDCYHYFSVTDRYLYEGIRLYEYIRKNSLQGTVTPESVVLKCVDYLKKAGDSVCGLDEVVGERSVVKSIGQCLVSIGGVGYNALVDTIFSIVHNFYNIARQMDSKQLVSLPNPMEDKRSNEWDMHYFHKTSSLSSNDLKICIEACYQHLIDFILYLLRELDSSSPSLQVNKEDVLLLLQRSMDSTTDTTYHTLLYTMLIDNKYEDLLVSLQSAVYLESFLLTYHMSLVYKYYTAQGEHKKAVGVMSKVAADNEQRVKIEDRLAYLRNAEYSLRILLEQGKESNRQGVDKEYSLLYSSLNDILGAIEIASYQVTLLPRLTKLLQTQKSRSRLLEYEQREQESLVGYIDKCQYYLVEVNVLFHEVCLTFGCYDMGLLLLCVCGVQDVEMRRRLVVAVVYSLVPRKARTESLQRFLLHKQEEGGIGEGQLSPLLLLSLPADQPPYLEDVEIWLPGLQLEAQRLLRQLPPSSAPLEDLLMELEDLFFSLFSCPALPVQERGQGAKVLLEGGVSLHLLVELYLHLLDTSSVEGSADHLAYLLSSFSLLLMKWVEEAFRLEQARAVEGVAFAELIRKGEARGWVEKARRLLVLLQGRRLQEKRLEGLLVSLAEELLSVQKKMREIVVI